jgi:ParB-like chromosome segregation protein Spo0J
VPRVSIAELLVSPLVDPTAHLDATRVQGYVESSDHPPVVVFDTSEGLLLADGYHRVAAARLRGEETVDAELRAGSRGDALRYAAATGAAQRGIGVDEALAHIKDRSLGRWGADG